MKKPVLVIMAAGMGSRYGGLKQIDPVDAEGHIIMDFSIYDAKRAGFEKVVFIIKKEIEEDFKEVIGNRLSNIMEVSYAYQELDAIPENFRVPEGRKKPWGTAHAILSAAGQIDGPFAVINADDFYGYHAFSEIYQFLTTHEDTEQYAYAMVGYRLKNTVTENGSVARGVCRVDENKNLQTIEEKTRIEKREDGIAFTEDDGVTWNPLGSETIVSMNLWGFTESILKEIREEFSNFLKENLEKNPLKCEYFLPSVVSRLLEQGKATVTVLESEDKWYGVTYKEDKPLLVQAIQHFKEEGIYPQHLWEE